jgi:acyl carrier protein
VTAELQRVSEIVCRIGKLAQIGPEQDFYAAGLSSVSALALLLELETAFGVSIPDDQFVASRTPGALARVVAGLRREAEPCPAS